MLYATPQPLKSEPAPFDHPDWIFELKYDRFRAVAHVENGRSLMDESSRFAAQPVGENHSNAINRPACRLNLVPA
jgi:hypothetical protein